MIVSIPETIKHQKLERKLFLKKTYGEAENLMEGGFPVNGYKKSYVIGSIMIPSYAGISRFHINDMSGKPLRNLV